MKHYQAPRAGLFLIFGMAVSTFGLVSISVADWPQWRGPSRDGHIADETWPDKLSDDHLQPLWRMELGPSYSGPIVVGDRVFVTETANKKTETVYAIDTKTGEELWQRSWPGAMKVPFFARSNGSWIRSTPAYDEGRLYVGGIRDVLVCLDAETGAEIWKLDFVDATGSALPNFGFVSSPLIHNNALIVQAGGAVFALNKHDGSVIWKSMDDKGGMMGSAFSSPYIGELNGKKQLIVQTRTTLAGLDLATGEELWSQEIPAFRGMNILTPIIFDGGVYTSSYGGKTLMIGVSGDDAVQRWENKAQGYMSTPVVIDGYAYMHLRNQRYTCIRLLDGNTQWTSKPYGKYASLITNGQKILALDQRGELLLLAASPDEFQVLDSREITDEETWAHLAIAGNRLYVRELNAITAYQWQ